MYAVVSYYSFDHPQVDIFNTFHEAEQYLKKTAHEEYSICVNENGWDSEIAWGADGLCATLTTHFGDRNDVTEFAIASLVNDSR